MPQTFHAFSTAEKNYTKNEFVNWTKPYPKCMTSRGKIPFFLRSKLNTYSHLDIASVQENSKSPIFRKLWRLKSIYFQQFKTIYQLN